MAKMASGKAILRRIDQRIAELKAQGQKLTDRSLSIRATGSADTLRSIRRNIKEGRQHGVSTQTLARLARVLETTASWLSQTQPGEIPDDHIDSSAILADKPPDGRRIRIVGYVGAGSVAHYYAISQEDFEEVQAPANATDKTVAVEIKGKSFGPLMDTWLVFYDDVRSPVTRDEFHNQICVVGLSDDRILIKQVKFESDGSVSLISNSNEPPIPNAELEWAAKVTDLRPR